MIANQALHSGRLRGHRPNRSSVVQQWEEGAQQLSPRPLPQIHQHHFQHPHPPRRRLRRRPGRLHNPPDRQHPVDLSIPSIVQLILRTPGPLTRRRGAAECTIAAALLPHRRRSPSSCQFRSLSRPQPIHTIVLMVSQTGKQAGQYPRRNGAAGSTGRVVRIKAVAV